MLLIFKIELTFLMKLFSGGSASFDFIHATILATQRMKSMAHMQMSPTLFRIFEPVWTNILAWLPQNKQQVPFVTIDQITRT